MEDFEALLEANRGALERFVRYRVPSFADAEDIIQETCISAYKSFGRLKRRESFKAWLICIAKNKCVDYYRRKSDDVSLEVCGEAVLPMSRCRAVKESPVLDTLAKLSDKDRQIMLMYYFEDYKQSEISRDLGLPLGTVKSRLNAARNNFKRLYPYPPGGEKTMKKMPETMPEYRIIPCSEAPFNVKWEELMGWFIVPREGERLSWAMYDFPERKRGEYVELEVSGRAEIHGITGAVVKSREFDAMPCNRIDETAYAERTFVAELTDTHCRFLAESHKENGVLKVHTFLDGDEFLPNWGFGENNCGSETNISAKGDITCAGGEITAKDKPFLLDVVGRYTVEIGEKRFDTICVVDVETYNGGVMSEQYLDRSGRTVLWRRFNRDDWGCGKPWTERLPENEIVRVNGAAYVHWYDCITDYII